MLLSHYYLNGFFILNDTLNYAHDICSKYSLNKDGILLRDKITGAPITRLYLIAGLLKYRTIEELAAAINSSRKSINNSLTTLGTPAKPAYVQWRRYLLSLLDLAHCGKCGNYVLKESCYKNSYYCSICDREHSKQSRLLNPDRVKAYSKYYYENNKELMQLKSASSRAKKIGSRPKWQDVESLLALRASRKAGEQIDHYYPLIHENLCGLDCIDNMRCIPVEENQAKGNKRPEDFYSETIIKEDYLDQIAYINNVIDKEFNI